MNVIVGVAPNTVEDILLEFYGRSVTGIWTNPSEMVIVDLKCSEAEYQSLKIRPGAVIWGAWDDGVRVEARPDVSIILGGRTLNTVHKWFGDPDKQL